jgi:formiminoglutamase
MLPYGPPALKDAGRERPVICLGNNGDARGRQRPGTLATCPEGWITALAASFAEEFSIEGAVTINTPFSGGFITNAHYWHKGIPWIQVEVNRSLYEDGSGSPGTASVEQDGVVRTGKRIWQVLCAFWDELGE